MRILRLGDERLFILCVSERMVEWFGARWVFVRWLVHCKGTRYPIRSETTIIEFKTVVWLWLLVLLLHIVNSKGLIILPTLLRFLSQHYSYSFVAPLLLAGLSDWSKSDCGLPLPPEWIWATPFHYGSSYRWKREFQPNKNLPKKLNLSVITVIQLILTFLPPLPPQSEFIRTNLSLEPKAIRYLAVPIRLAREWSCFQSENGEWKDGNELEK